MRVDLKNRVALVTGAGRGIGKAIADALADNGARVLYTDVDLPAVTAAAQRPGCRALLMDVTNSTQVESVMDAVQPEFGRLDVLVNNAGVNTLAHRVTIEQFPEDEWQRILQVDLTGLFLVSRAAARRMLPQKGGRIINIASIAGLVPLRLQCPYVAAKAGV